MNQVRPTSIDNLQHHISERIRERQPIIWDSQIALPGQSAFDLLSDGAFDLSELNQVIDYPARDLTITVQAGMTLSQLQTQLSEHHQWLPVDLADPESTTIAQMIVQHAYGSLNAGFGTVRDWLLGIAAIDGQGRLFHSGGRVVKNVAGYDLGKLLVGSRGQLAIPAEVTLQVFSRPESISLCRFQAVDATALKDVVTQLRSLPFSPVVLDVNCSTWELTVAVAGDAQTTAALTHTLVDSISKSTGITLTETGAWIAEQHSCWQQLFSPSKQPSASSDNVIQLGVRPSQTIELLEKLNSIGWQAVGLVSKGSVIARSKADNADRSSWANAWDSWQPLQPNLIVFKGGSSLQQTAQQQTEACSAWPLMQKLKHEFDPHGLLTSSNMSTAD